jgi:hypothetical protein
LPPLALDEDKPVPPDGLDETGVVWHANRSEAGSPREGRPAPDRLIA